jgi:hypothetical protein
LALQPARAQTRSDSAEGTPFFGTVINHSDFYITKLVAESYRRSAAADFARGAGQAGFNDNEIRSFSQGMITGNIRVVPGGPAGWIVATGSVVSYADTPKSSFLNLFRSTERATTFFERFAAIKLVVQPAPPRDYKVVVNGEECAATDAGVYKVMPGESAINVTRPSKPQCEWHGPIATGATKEVDCSL